MIPMDQVCITNNYLVESNVNNCKYLLMSLGKKFINIIIILLLKNATSIDFPESNQSEASMKKSMNSLLYVRKLCITTMRNLKSGSANPSEMITMVYILCLCFICRPLIWHKISKKQTNWILLKKSWSNGKNVNKFEVIAENRKKKQLWKMHF